MNIYIAVSDNPGRGQSAIVGAFSTEERARAACQEIEDEDAEETGDPARQLAWTDTAAEGSDGDMYDVILVNLDVRSG